MATWRNCINGTVLESTIPEKWMQTSYTGSEGGICWEPVPITITSSSIGFSYDNYSSQYPQPIRYVLENTSVLSSYRVSLATDQKLFTINPATVELAPNQTQQILVSLPPSNVNRFLPGITQLKLEVNITKL